MYLGLYVTMPIRELNWIMVTQRYKKYTGFLRRDFNVGTKSEKEKPTHNVSYYTITAKLSFQNFKKLHYTTKNLTLMPSSF